MYQFICRYREHSVSLPIMRESGLVNEKIMIRNGIIKTEDEKVANALRENKWFGIDWFEDKKNREVVNEFNRPEDQNLNDYLGSMTNAELRNIAKDKKISKYPELLKMKKIDLISRMIEKRHLLGEYDIGGD